MCCNGDYRNMKRPPLAGARPRTLAGLFLIVVGLPAIALVWLGTQLLLQDRSVAMQRESERRQADLQGAARALDKLLEGTGRRLPEGAARYTISASEIAVEPASSVLWLPNMPKLPAAPDAPFAEMERVEFQGSAARALVFYEQQTASTNPAVRAGAWLRAARVHWREQRWADALRAYGRLAQIASVSIDGLPADFVARRARCDVLREAGWRSELGREAEELRTDLLANRWALDRASWERAAAQITEWTGRAMDVPESRRTLSETGSWLWTHRADRQEKVVVANNRPVTLMWSTGSVIAVPPDLVEQWLRQAATHSSSLVSVLTESGLHVAGPRPVSGRSLTESVAETGLPWVLVASPRPDWAHSPELAARRRLLAFGLATIMLLIAGAGYLLWRVVHRELAVARLQTDFVAAVSHEFRTPLASLRHVTELLTEHDDLPRERRRSFYEALGRNTERLHRLVESLLDFARMEGGRKPYDLRPMDAAEFTAQVVSEFQKEAGPRGFTVDLAVEGANGLPVLADSAALGNALWNLLDNAVKYSPEKHSVHVSVGRHPNGVAIAVADEGIGIPAREQKEVFRRFVRGAESKRLGIKGTGLGLAMVSHIVSAHGGAIELESEEGAGSTFRVVLPERV
jgi:signal transduction histidine kinase